MTLHGDGCGGPNAVPAIETAAAADVKRRGPAAASLVTNDRRPYGSPVFREVILNRTITPTGIRPPFARYSHAVEVTAGSRLVYVSGQVGARADDTVPETVEAQAEICFENVRVILAEAGLTLADTVRINAFVTRPEHLADYMKVRDRHVTTPPPASTLMVVSGFARPNLLVEIEVVAAAQA